MTRRTRLAVTGVLATTALALSGCGSSSSKTPSMMGNQGSRSSGFGPMMGSAPHGYHLRSLACTAPGSLPGTSVYVMLGDMGMTRMMGGIAGLGGHMMLHALPARVPAGKVSFVAGNMGWRTHELVVLPFADGQGAGDRVPGSGGRIDETGALGEASAPCAAGSGEGITSGSVGWVTLTLRPGRYELVCNLRNHYANGMYQELTVS